MAKIDEKITVLTIKGAISGSVVRTDHAGNPLEVFTGEDFLVRSDSGVYYHNTRMKKDSPIGVTL